MIKGYEICSGHYADADTERAQASFSGTYQRQDLLCSDTRSNEIAQDIGLHVARGKFTPYPIADVHASKK
jgi:hypothetical protein